MANNVIYDFLKYCENGSLYSKEVLKAEDMYELFTTAHYQFDHYCIYCNKHSTFRVNFTLSNQNSVTANSELFPAKHFYFKSMFKCVRVETHQYMYYWLYSNNTVKKIGQEPSLEDIASADIQKYRAVLDKSYFAELHRATGLASHGIGIGSFVYLRRIFEKLIADHRERLEAASGPIDGFDTLRIDEKIQALKTVLPPILVEYKTAYSILSKGIHELDEDTCRKFFPIVRAAIIAILEQDLQEKAKAESQKALKDEMARIAGEIKSGAVPPKAE